MGLQGAELGLASYRSRRAGATIMFSRRQGVAAMPLPFELGEQEDELVELPPREQTEGELARRVGWIEGLAAREE